MPNIRPKAKAPNNSTKSINSIRRMRPKTKQFLDIVASDNKIDQTDAYLATHKTTNRNTARSEASKTIAKPSSQIYLKKHVSMAKRVMVEIALSGERDGDRIKAATDILDRNTGKAIQKVESTNTNLNINIEASKELGDEFTAFLKDKTSI